MPLEPPRLRERDVQRLDDPQPSTSDSSSPNLKDVRRGSTLIPTLARVDESPPDVVAKLSRHGARTIGVVGNGNAEIIFVDNVGDGEDLVVEQ